MSRSGYNDGCDGWELNLWRGAVESAIRGKRGQAFLREMRDALDAMPEKRLVAGDLVTPEGECCAMGAVAIRRGLDVSGVDETERDQVAQAFGIAEALAAEIAFENDEREARWRPETPEERWKRMRAWVESQLAATPQPSVPGSGDRG